jgi:hypothetical protein
MNCFFGTVCTYVLKKIVIMENIIRLNEEPIKSPNSIILKKVTFLEAKRVARLAAKECQ